MDETCNKKGKDTAESDTVASIEFVEPNFNVYDFQEVISESLIVKYQVLKMKNSIFLWIGLNSSPKFSDLSLSMKSPYEKTPLTSRILGHSSESPSVNLASRLTKKLEKPVYVSFNVPTDRLTLPDIEKRLLEEIQKNPDVF